MSLVIVRRHIILLIVAICLPFVVSLGSGARGQGNRDFFFGVCASPARDRSFGRDPKKTIESLKDLGARWVRVHWAWKEIEPKKGNISAQQLARYDDIINRLRKRNIEVVLLLGGVPSWSGTRPDLRGKGRGRGYIPSEKSLKEIVQFLVAHYKGRVRYYQILNETNLPAHWTEPEIFARQMRVAYQTAKSKDPTCKVIMGGFGSRGMIPKVEYLERFIKAGGADSVDILDFHMYNYISRLYEDIAALKTVLEKHKVTKPIWILETGDPSNFTNRKVIRKIARRDRYQDKGPWDWPIFDEEEQSRRLVQRMVLALSQQVERVFWFAFQDRLSRNEVDPTKKSSGHKNTMGLLYPDFSPKKSFCAYKFLISKLAGTQFQKPLELGHPNCMGYVFKGGKEWVAVVWTWEGSAEVDMALSAKEAHVYDKLGKSLGVLRADKAGKIRMKLTPDPLYLIL